LKAIAADAKPVDKGAALLHLLREYKPEGVEK